MVGRVGQVAPAEEAARLGVGRVALRMAQMEPGAEAHVELGEQGLDPRAPGARGVRGEQVVQGGGPVGVAEHFRLPLAIDRPVEVAEMDQQNLAALGRRVAASDQGGSHLRWGGTGVSDLVGRGDLRVRRIGTSDLRVRGPLLLALAERRLVDGAQAGLVRAVPVGSTVAEMVLVMAMDLATV